MVEQVLDDPATDVEVAPGGPSTFDTDQETDPAIANLRAQMIKARDKTGKFVSKKDRQKTQDATPKDDSTTDPDSQADDKGAKQGAKDTEPAAKDTADTDTTDTPKELSAREIESAKQLGFSIDEIAKFDPEAFGIVLDALGRKHNKGMSDLGHLQQKLRVSAGQKAEPSKDTPKDGQTADYTFSDEDFDSLGEDGVSGKLTNLFTAMSDRIAHLESRDSDREASNLAEKADTFFKGLDAKEFPQFGSGPMVDLTEGSAEADARQQVMDEAEVLQMASDLQGKKLGLRQAMDKAVQLLFSDNIAAAERRRITDEVAKRRRGAGTRPSHRKAKPTPATTKSEQNAELTELAKAHGMSWNT